MINTYTVTYATSSSLIIVTFLAVSCPGHRGKLQFAQLEDERNEKFLSSSKSQVLSKHKGYTDPVDTPFPEPLSSCPFL